MIFVGIQKTLVPLRGLCVSVVSVLFLLKIRKYFTTKSQIRLRRTLRYTKKNNFI